MTTNIERQFFDTFGIEPKCETRDEYHKYECYGMVDCDECASAIYPQITDRILLELICILNTVTIPDLADINIGRLKKTILEECIRALTTIETPTKEEFINNIRTLFKEV